ncbi:MAG: serine/threonine-protein kinase [Myxococcales bacterium]
MSSDSNPSAPAPTLPGTPSADVEPAADHDLRESLAKTAAASPKKGDQLPKGSLIGRYLVTGVLGEGGMGTVYSAYDPDLGRPVAIKLVKFSGEDADSARARLLHEAQAMARLAHPNVLAVYDAGPFGEELYVAMELVDGPDLFRWLREKPRTRREIFSAFLDAGRGLVAAHQAGMVHRDFKPDNVLMGKDGRVRVTDFGLAHMAELPTWPAPPLTGAGSKSPNTVSQSISGLISGTPAYMAPEQFAAGATDARADQFAFCVSLWEALVGERPFEGKDLATLRNNVVNGNVRLTPPHPGHPGMSGELRRLLLRGLSVRPADRHPDLQLVLRFLERRLTRSRERALALTAALLVLAGAIGYFALRSHQEEVRCAHEAQQALSQMWGAPQRDAVSAALNGSGIPQATVRSTLDHFDGSMRDWTVAQTRVCEALRTRKSAAALVQTAQCLDGNALRADAVVRVLSRPLPEGVPALERVLDRWESPLTCVTPEAVRSPVPSPEERALRQGVEEVVLASLLGRHEQAIAGAQRLLVPARERRALAEAAELQSALASSLWNKDGPTEDATKAFRQAIRDADASGRDRLSFSTRLDMANFLSQGAGKPAEAEPFALDAQAWLQRAGGERHLEHDLVFALGSIALDTGKSEEAIAAFQRQVELSKGHTRATRAFSNLAVAFNQAGRMAEAIEAMERQVVELQAFEETLPTELAQAFANLALMRMNQGQLGEALSAVDRAAATLAPVREQNAYTALWIDLCRAEILELGGKIDDAGRLYVSVLAQPKLLRDSDLAEANAGLARTLVARGKADEALPAAAQAVKLGRDAADPFTRGYSFFALAQALWEVGERPRALAEAQKALSAFDQPSQKFLRSRVEGWLAGKR